MRGPQIIKDRVAAVRETSETSILRIANGRICEVWVNVDLLTLRREIGATTIPKE
jgi:hypothetical protein